jgi:pyruvate dehydrogenase E2 component (dihydrolipoamide acetyltransferase)
MANEIEVKIPDIGGATGVDVIEILVQVGEEISKDTSLVTLESDKASMEIPSPVSGKVTQITTKVGDKVSEGDVILYVSSTPAAEPVNEEVPQKQDAPEPEAVKAPVVASEPKQTPLAQSPQSNSTLVYAGPAVRRIAREFGVDLTQVKGSADKGRILKEDVQNFVKSRLNSGASSFALPSSPVVDFTQFGAVEIKPLNKIKKLTGANVHRSWISIPHVTQFDEADITDLEDFRKSELEKAASAGYKLTLLAFACAVVAKALRVFPQFNASLDPSGENLIYKQYYNIGIAVETPNGLVVPVIQKVDRLSVAEIAQEMGRLSAKAREKGLMPNDMSGGCFTISSLGGIGGTAFTPIVNSPEVAILGLSRSTLKPIYINGVLQPRLMLPLSLSYDHRVIDGAEAARFTRYLCDSLSDIRLILV